MTKKQDKQFEVISSQELVRNLKEEQLARRKNEKFRYYVPNETIERFIDMVGGLEFFIVFISAANGVGKSTVGANILANMMYESDNEFFQAKMFTDFPYKKKGRVVSDSALIEKNIVDALKEWFPKGRYTTAKRNKHYESYWETDTGWNFDIMTYDQAPKEFEGVTLGWAWLDEPPPDAVLKATISRMRTGGVIFITATPLSGSGYLFDMFVEGKNTSKYTMPDGSEREIERKVAHITADIECACIEHGVRGHLRHSDIENMIAEYDEDERQARIYGKFQHLVGQVFKKFDKDVHVIKPFHINMTDYMVYNMLDAHPRNPDAIMWVAFDKYGTAYVIDELYRNFDDVDEMASVIKQKDAQYRVVRHLADPSAWPVNQHDDVSSLADRLAEHGLYYEKATKSRALADDSIKNALNFTQVKGKILNPPKLYIFDTCERTLFEMPRYRWDEYTGKSADRKDRKEKPVDKDDHMIECLGRALIQDPMFKVYTREKQIWEDNGGEETVRDSLDPYKE